MGTEAGEIDSPLGTLLVRRATIEHASAVREMGNVLARWMLRRGIDQWRPGELSLDWIERCVASGAVRVICQGDRLIGSVTVVWEDPLTWGERPEPAGYIHMLMLDRRFAGHGIGRSILEYAERSIVEAGRRRARLDCRQENSTLRGYYEDAGYGFVGCNTVPHLGEPRDTALYEKPLS